MSPDFGYLFTLCHDISRTILLFNIFSLSVFTVITRGSLWITTCKTFLSGMQCIPARGHFPRWKTGKEFSVWVHFHIFSQQTLSVWYFWWGFLLLSDTFSQSISLDNDNKRNAFWMYCWRIEINRLTSPMVWNIPQTIHVFWSPNWAHILLLDHCDIRISWNTELHKILNWTDINTLTVCINWIANNLRLMLQVGPLKGANMWW